MAADCKSAAPRSYGGSNPPLCTSIYAPRAYGLAVTEQVEVAGISGTKKLLAAFAIYAVLGALAWTTLSEPKFRYATLAILALFALRTWSWSRKQERDRKE
jgi:hypothetical protein